MALVLIWFQRITNACLNLVETDLRDHHTFIYSTLQATFQKEVPKTLIYSDFRKFTNLHNSGEYCSLKESFLEVLGKHPPKKIIFLNNQKPHNNETLRSVTMKRSQLKKKAMKSKLKNDKTEYEKQCNIVVKLNNCCKKTFFDNLETKNNSKTFWSTWNSYFTNKHSQGDADILLIENFTR